MDKQEALDRLKLIETMVSEQRGSSIENGQGLVWMGSIGSLLLLLVYAVKHALLPDWSRPALRLMGAALLVAACLLEWRRYRRFKKSPTLAYRVYLAFGLGTLFFLTPVILLEQRGLLTTEASISLVFALVALSFAIYRPILGHRWLDYFAFLWFAAACLTAAGYGLDPALGGALLMALGMALPGWLIRRAGRSPRP